jgi:Tfp pilus assembly protein PilF
MMLSFLNIGNVFNKSYDPDQALKYYQRALDLSKAARYKKSSKHID